MYDTQGPRKRGLIFKKRSVLFSMYPHSILGLGEVKGYSDLMKDPPSKKTILFMKS